MAEIADKHSVKTEKFSYPLQSKKIAISEKETGEICLLAQSLPSFITRLKAAESKRNSDETILLTKQIDRIKKEKQRLVIANLGLVYKFVKEFETSLGNANLSQEDLFGEGIVGLERAIMKFDSKRGTKFSTYASPWIKAQMVEALSKARFLGTIPPSAQRSLRLIYKAKTEFLQSHQQEPSIEELAEITGINPKTIQKLLLSATKTTSYEEYSLSNGKKAQSSLLDSFCLSEEISENKELDKKETNSKIKKGLAVLDEREKDIIAKTYGLGKEKKMSLKKIGEIYGISGERVRQIRERAYAKMEKEIFKL